jgi:hypothetical protein
MKHPNDLAIMQLEADHPEWQCWIVWRYVGGPLWCARPWSDERAVINAGSAAQLETLIMRSEAQWHPGRPVSSD